MTSTLGWGWVVSTTPRPLYPREIPGTHCTGGWVGPRAGLDGWGKSSLHRDSIPGPSSPQRVAIPTEIFRPGGKRIFKYMTILLNKTTGQCVETGLEEVRTAINPVKTQQFIILFSPTRFGLRGHLQVEDKNTRNTQTQFIWHWDLINKLSITDSSITLSLKPFEVNRLYYKQALETIPSVQSKLSNARFNIILSHFFFGSELAF